MHTNKNKNTIQEIFWGFPYQILPYILRFSCQKCKKEYKMSFSKAGSCYLGNVVHLGNVHYVLYVQSGCPYSFVFWSFVVLFILQIYFVCPNVFYFLAPQVL